MFLLMVHHHGDQPPNINNLNNKDQCPFGEVQFDNAETSRVSILKLSK